MPLGINGTSGTAPGYRWPISGVPGGVGNDGFSYSSSVSGILGMTMSFYVTSFTPSYSFNRAAGRQLRCLSE
ncbi:hypothetical protein [uncultured Rikenella sp.]|uniref:hypothetical protein n=1 Tax=uncultured Rikenella sp. TaxID=368003 RepID=UPI0025DC73E6|nr:hypothetical protein [uncultured Rikenella sp.]